MNPDTLKEFLEHINIQRQAIYNINDVTPLDNKTAINIKDTTYKYNLPGMAPENDAVLMISNEQYPDFINNSVNVINGIADLLSTECRSVVLEPVSSGSFMGLSYAIWPKHKPVSNAKILKAIQKRTIAKNVFKWLKDVASDTFKNKLSNREIDTLIRAPIRTLADSPRQSESVQKKAAHALEQLDQNEWRPITTLQHSDFWLGNILIENNHTRNIENPYGFYVIDWGTAFISGGPATDMVQFCISANTTKARALKELIEYCETIGGTIKDIEKYMLVGLGNIGQNLDRFPEERFIEKCSQNMLYLQKLLSSK